MRRLTLKVPATPLDLPAAQQTLADVLQRSTHVTRLTTAYAPLSLLQHAFSMLQHTEPLPSPPLAYRLTHLTAMHLTADTLPVLGDCVNLQHLDISGSRVGAGEGARMLAHALRAMPALTYLGVAECGLGGEALAPALAGLGRLQHLHISQNRLGAACARMLHGLHAAQGSANGCIHGGLSGLLTLDVRSNAINDSMAPALASVLRKMPSLQRLLLTDNGLCGCDLADALRGLTDLQVGFVPSPQTPNPKTPKPQNPKT